MRHGLGRIGVVLILLITAGCRTRPASESGADLYDFYCARCHGPDARGDRRQLTRYPKADLIASPHLVARERDFVVERIRSGRGPMPAFRDKLTPAEVETITDHLFTLVPVR